MDDDVAGPVVVGDRDEAVDEALEVEIAEGRSPSGVSFLARTSSLFFWARAFWEGG
jgi:hypothetical protein